MGKKPEAPASRGLLVPGSVVVLASGGPTMTVRKVIEGGFPERVDTDWFDGMGTLRHATFEIGELVIVKYVRIEA